jgi:hypothetical protein
MLVFFESVGALVPFTSSICSYPAECELGSVFVGFNRERMHVRMKKNLIFPDGGLGTIYC